MTREGQFELEKHMRDEDKVGASPVLVGCDHGFKAIRAMAIDIKGPTQSAVKWLVSQIDQAGCRGLRRLNESICGSCIYLLISDIGLFPEMA